MDLKKNIALLLLSDKKEVRVARHNSGKFSKKSSIKT